VAEALTRDGLIWGRFRITETLGRSGAGRLLKVTDAETGEPRALRIVPRDREGPLWFDQLDQLAKLRHPSLPRVFEVGRTQEPIEDLPAGSLCYFAEWIAGERCDVRAWSGHDLGARVWALLGDIASALATLHAAGLIHGNVAPHNLWLTEAGHGVLANFGFGGGPRSLAGAHGTLAYQAPELLAGDGEPRSDLYGLGVTIVRLVRGDSTGAPGDLVPPSLVDGPVAELPVLPHPLVDLVGRMAALDPDARPRSALAVLDELDQLAPAVMPFVPRRVWPKVGTPPAPVTWPGATAMIDAIARSLASHTAVTLMVGTAASGARALVDRALRRHQLEQITGTARPLRGAPGELPPAAPDVAWPAARIAGSLDEVGARLAVSASDPAASARSWIERVARAARRGAVPVVFDLAGDSRAGDLVSALARAEGETPAIAIVDRDPVRGGRPGVAVHDAPILDADGVAALVSTMLGVAPPRAWAHALHVASTGLAMTVIELVRSIAGEPHPFAVDWTARTVAGIVELRTRQLRATPTGARRVIAAIAVWGGRVRIDRALATLRADGKSPAALADVAEIERLGLAHRHGDEVTIDRAVVEAILAVAGGDAIARLAAAALDGPFPDRAMPAGVVRGGGPSREAAPGTPRPERGAADRPAAELAGREASVLRIVPLLERVELDADRARLACEAAQHLLARGRADRARALLWRARSVDPAHAGLLAAEAAIASHAYDAAAADARAAAEAGADPVIARLVIARAAEGAGALDAAEGTLAALHATYPEHAEVAGTYARFLVARGRYREARAVATAGGPLAGLRAEAAGLAALSLGELEAADAAFAVLEVGAAAAGGGAAAGRALSLRARVAHARGQLGLASDRHREAARRLGEAGEVTDAAIAELRLGAVLIERGRASEALPRLAAAERVFAELGGMAEQGAALLERGRALLLLGQIDEARSAADAVIARADPHLDAFAWLVAGDARTRLGDDAGAVRCYREALALAGQRGDARGQVRAYSALAELGQGDGDGVAIEALCASDDDRDRWMLARGRRALREPRSALGPGSAGSLGDATVALARACGEVAVRAADADRLERAFRGHAIAAQLAHRARDAGLARAEAERARVAHATWIAATAPAFRPALDGDPDLARLPGRDPGEPSRHRHEDPQAASLRRLLAVSRRLHTEPSVARILDDTVDTAIELSCAERGFVLLREPDGALAVAVSRNFFAGELAPGSGPRLVGPSSSYAIAERVATTGEPVLSVGAVSDERHQTSHAVGAAAPGGPLAAIGPRSLLAVPLHQRGAVTGCLYVDHRLHGGAFDAAAVSVLGELAAIAAIAIENARSTGELRRAAREVDERNRRLSAELAAAGPEPAQPAAGEDLRLRPALAATEQAYLAAAMARAKGNQTVAARLLGLSRFGLQKKLRRRASGERSAVDGADETEEADEE
jgi:GAF domain-containing protein